MDVLGLKIQTAQIVKAQPISTPPPINASLLV